MTLSPVEYLRTHGQLDVPLLVEGVPRNVVLELMRDAGHLLTVYSESTGGFTLRPEITPQQLSILCLAMLGQADPQ